MSRPAFPLRTDPQTGAANLIAFAELLVGAPAGPRALVSVTLGAAAGADPLRWLAMILREELAGTIYRTGGAEFVAVLAATGDQQQQVARLQERLTREAARLGLPAAPAISLHQLPAAGADPATALAHLAGAPADDLRPVLNALVGRVAQLGPLLADARQLGSDPVTGLPSAAGARERATQTLALADTQGQPCGLLLIDGDSLRRYNELGYAAGDRMIRDLSAALREQLRPNDTLARWQSGDQFLVILPQTGASGAATLAERLRRRVEELARFWPYPITISLGVAAYPQHGATLDALLAGLAAALASAKHSGKNRLAMAEPVAP